MERPGIDRSTTFHNSSLNSSNPSECSKSLSDELWRHSWRHHEGFRKPSIASVLRAAEFAGKATRWRPLCTTRECDRKRHAVTMVTNSKSFWAECTLLLLMCMCKLFKYIYKRLIQSNINIINSYCTTIRPTSLNPMWWLSCWKHGRRHFFHLRS